MESTDRRNRRVVEEFILIWLDLFLDELNDDYKSSIDQFREIVNSIELFNDVEHCSNFLDDIKDEKVFLIISSSFAEEVLPDIHKFNQLELTYVLATDQSEDEPWTDRFQKIKGVFTRIDSICEVLKEDIHQTRDSLTPVTILPASSSLSPETKSNQVDPAFMYSQLLKEIFIDIEEDADEVLKLSEFSREQYSKNESELKFIDEFEKDYFKYSLLWWYSREGFINSFTEKLLTVQKNEIEKIDH